MHCKNTPNILGLAQADLQILNDIIVAKNIEDSDKVNVTFFMYYSVSI
jgi:hypothetical protein